jgi:hypothetical protein
MKVNSLTTGGLTDVWMFFFRSTANNCCEKSAEAIVDKVTSLQKKTQEVSQLSKGRTLRSVIKFKLPSERKKAENIGRYLSAEG